MNRVNMILMLIWLSAVCIKGQTIDCDKKYTQKELSKIEYKIDEMDLAKKMGGEIVFHNKPIELSSTFKSEVKFESGQNIFMTIVLKKPIISYLLENGELNCYEKKSKITVLFKINNGNTKVFSKAEPVHYIKANGSYDIVYNLAFVDYSTKASRRLYSEEVISALNNLKTGENKIRVEIYGGNHQTKTEKALASGEFTYNKIELNNNNTGIYFSDIDEHPSSTTQLKNKFTTIINKKLSSIGNSTKGSYESIKFVNDWEYSKNSLEIFIDRIRHVKTLFRDEKGNYYCKTYLWKQNAIGGGKFEDEGSTSLLIEEKCNQE